MQRIVDVEANIEKECESRMKEDAAIHEKINQHFSRLLYWIMGSMATTIITLIVLLFKKGI